MGANIAAVILSQNVESMTRKEVTCIFCGLSTPMPASGPSRLPGRPPRHIAIVRCKVCGKEAPYRACDIIEFGEKCQARDF